MAAPSDPNNPYAPPPSVADVPPVIAGSAPPGGTQFAPCPKCGCTYATKAGFTWWGGLVGPAMFSHVNCKQCGKGYNGKSGKSNDMAITIYVIVSLVVGLAIFGALALGGIG